MQERQDIQVQSLGQEEPLEKEMSTRSSVLAWEIPWTEELVGLQSMGSQRVRHDWGSTHMCAHTHACTHAHTHIHTHTHTSSRTAWHCKGSRVVPGIPPLLLWYSWEPNIFQNVSCVKRGRGTNGWVNFKYLHPGFHMKVLQGKG